MNMRKIISPFRLPRQSRIMNYTLIWLFALLMITACQWGPKETELNLPAQFSKEDIDKTGLYFDLHQVKILETLPTEKYVYLKVSENDREFWIATRAGEFKKGSTYYYREALLKTSFKSEEHNRVFDSIYLVTQLVTQDHIKETALPNE